VENLSLKLIGSYLLVINVIGAGVTLWDKIAARNGAWRIPEKTLFLWCVLGGCPGVYLMMRLIRHKTLHRRFMWGIPLIFLAQCAAVLLIRRVIG
jgi:uncharacterized membrane protein YsdA (DUF1294 family)